MDAVCEDMSMCLSKYEPRFLTCSTDMIVSPPMVKDTPSVSDLYLAGTMGRNVVFESFILRKFKDIQSRASETHDFSF